MRILLLTDWMRHKGGVEAYVRWLRDALREEGDDVRLLTSSAGSAANGSANYVAYGANHPVAQSLLQIVNPLAMAAVRTAVRDFRPDVVHVHMFEHHLSPAILRPLRGVPIVLSIADYKSVCPTNSKLLPDGALCRVHAGSVCWRGGCVSWPHWLRDRPRYRLIRAWPGRMSRILVCSRWMRDVLAGEGVATEILPLPAAPPSPAFRRQPAPFPLFLYCGRLVREKGVALLLRAFATLRRQLPAARLRVVGDGPQRVELEAMAVALDLREAATFTGWLEGDAWERELAAPWALAAPSLWAEPFGLVALEATARGVPVIASAAGGFAETLEDGVTGLLFPNGDEKQLVECLLRVAEKRAFPSHAPQAEAAAKRIREHEPASHLRRLREIYKEVSGAARAMATPAA